MKQRLSPTTASSPTKWRRAEGHRWTVKTLSLFIRLYFALFYPLNPTRLQWSTAWRILPSETNQMNLLFVENQASKQGLCINRLISLPLGHTAWHSEDLRTRMLDRKCNDYHQPSEKRQVPTTEAPAPFPLKKKLHDWLFINSYMIIRRTKEKLPTKAAMKTKQKKISKERISDDE